MAWKDEMQAASFRGVPFLVDADRSTRGRRTVVHEYPKRPMPLVEDMDLATRDYKLSAWVAGPDCFTQRDALLKVIEEPGQGELVHPWYGRVMVVNTACEVSHSDKEGGVVRFDLVFVRGDAAGFPLGTANTGVRADLASNSVQTSAQSRFAAAMGIVDSAKVQAAAVQGRFREIGRALDEQAGPLLGLFRDVQSVFDLVMTAPAQFASQMFNMVGAVTRSFDGFSNLGAGFGAVSLAGIFGKSQTSQRVGSVALPPDPASAAVVRSVSELVRDAVLVDTARDVSLLPTAAPPARADGGAALEPGGEQAVTGTGDNGGSLAELLLGGEPRDLPVSEDVRAARDEYVAAVWTATLTAEAEHYEALTALRIAGIRHLDAVALRGLQLRPYTPAAVLPALVLAYREYADARRAGEIVTRNRVAHPGFLPAAELKLIRG